MTMAQLKSLVKKGESNILEFKKSTGQRSQAMQTVCAFLNSQVGGTLLFGVTDDGKIVGQEVSDKTKREIANEIEKIDPHADIKIASVPVELDKFVLVLSIKPGKNKPYTYDGRPYMRNESTTQQMPREEYHHLIYENLDLDMSWDSLTTNKCTLHDLDKKLIREAIRLGIAYGRLSKNAEKSTIPDFLRKLDLLVNDRLTNAAVLLFCKNEQKQFMHSEVRLARFEGLTKSVFLDRKDLHGNIFDLYENAFKYLHFNLPVAGRVVPESVKRIDTPAIPFDVLREAILNALVHRDYAMYSSSIYIAIYDDRVEIDNPGKLPSGVKLSDLTKKHDSVPRNPLIAKVLFTCGMIEKWGRGTLDIIELSKKAGNPLPYFEESTSGFSVILPLREPLSRLRPTLERVAE